MPPTTAPSPTRAVPRLLLTRDPTLLGFACMPALGTSQRTMPSLAKALSETPGKAPWMTGEWPKRGLASLRAGPSSLVEELQSGGRMWKSLQQLSKTLDDDRKRHFIHTAEVQIGLDNLLEASSHLSHTSRPMLMDEVADRVSCCVSPAESQGSGILQDALEQLLVDRTRP